MPDLSAAAPTVTEQKQLVQRILASELFSKSHRLSAFLRYIFEQYSHGQISAINEARIGTEVFGRPAGYHAGEDSIVRSQARFLRQRLEEYFATTGSSEPILLLVPKGSYVPVFERREVAPALPTPAVPSVGALSPVPATVAAAPSKVADRSILKYRILLSLAVGVVVAMSVRLYQLRSRQETHSEPPAVRAFWESLFNPAKATLIVPADSTLVLMEEITGKPVHLNSYIARDYTNTKPPESVALWNMLSGSQYTSTADLNLVARLQRVPEAISVQPEIRYARDLSLKELKERNAILIGGMRANPWMEMFASSTNFDVDYDVDSHRNVVRNRAPRPNEQPLYIEDTRDTAGARAYGVVVYLPSLDSQGHALLVEGTSKAGTEAAAEFLTSPAFGQFLRSIAPDAHDVPNFELLLSAGIMDGASYHPAVVCWHLLHRTPNS
jgi:hypothetical protein